MPAATDARLLLDAKMSIPAELRTAEWAPLPQWLRERAFYMSAVARTELLEEFRSEVGKIAQGTASIPEAEKRLGAFLEKTGYKPAPGQEGTIKDLRTWRRMRVALRTNVELLQGYGQKQRGMTPGAMAAFPAWELVRIMPRSAPRDWDGRHPQRRRSGHAPGPRWLLAGGKLYGGRMIAMKDSPVWLELGSFEDGLGVDYPPFAWGSGMGWKAVSYSQADALGVIPADWSPPAETPPESPNASLQSTPAIADRALRNELSRRLRGLAEWRKDTLVFTDPNGSRPMAPEHLIQTWAKGMPDDFHDLPGNGLMQQASALRWITNHEDLRDTNDRNVWDDLIRLAMRLISRPVERLYRGMAMSTEKLDEFLRLLEPRIYQTRREYPLESWTDSPAAAVNYARTGGKGWSVLLSVAKPTRAADFSAFARAYSGQIAKQTSPPLATESEWVYTTGRKFKVLATTKDTSSRTVRIELEELP